MGPIFVTHHKLQHKLSPSQENITLSSQAKDLVGRGVVHAFEIAIR